MAAKFIPNIDPVFDPENFPEDPAITNDYLTYTPGTIYNYEVKDAAGQLIELRTVEVTSDTIEIAGVTCIIVIDTVTDPNGQLIEVAKDYFAQDADGNVWYFGEAVENYENGELVDTAGSWRADGKGAGPGIIMLADPKEGDSYAQEDAKGAQDYAIVTSTDETIKLEKYGNLKDLLQTNDVNPLDTVGGQPAEQEFKYYSDRLNTEVYATTAERVGKEYLATETMQLVSITTNGTTQLVQAMASFGATESVSSPVTASGPDEHASQHALAAPGHLT